MLKTQLLDTKPSRIKVCFDALKKAQKKALIPFITAGDISLELTLQLMHAAVKAGASIIELGIPFSDPMADGPVIQKASERALIQGVTLRQVLSLVGDFRKIDMHTPIVLMGYLNPIEQMGWAQFATLSAQNGVDGILVVDLPPEESHEVAPYLKEAGIDQIFLLAPTTTDQRIEHITRSATGYIYYVSLRGVTGSGQVNLQEVADKVRQIKAHTLLPVCVGFGIRDAITAKKIADESDGIVIGSTLVQMIYDLHQKSSGNEIIIQLVSNWLQEIRQAMDYS